MQHNLWTAAPLRRFRFGMIPQIFYRCRDTEVLQQNQSGAGAPQSKVRRSPDERQTAPKPTGRRRSQKPPIPEATNCDFQSELFFKVTNCDLKK